MTFRKLLQLLFRVQFLRHLSLAHLFFERVSKYVPRGNALFDLRMGNKASSSSHGSTFSRGQGATSNIRDALPNLPGSQPKNKTGRYAIRLPTVYKYAVSLVRSRVLRPLTSAGPNLPHLMWLCLGYQRTVRCTKMLRAERVLRTTRATVSRV